MSKEITIKMQDIGGGLPYLAGATDGAQSLGKLIASLPQCDEVLIVCIDFQGVEVATASYLRESVIAFRDYCRSCRANLYPVVCNANPKVREELDALLKLRGDALVVCEMKGDRITAASVAGKLEEKQLLTLQTVLRAKRVDAATLAGNHTTETLGPTAWNNRLTSLSAKGILKESQIGRVKYYEPVVEALSHGT